MIIADVDDPAPASDRQPAEGDAVARIELTLAVSAAVLRVCHQREGSRRAEQDGVMREAK
jgi:hypothetical protein